jgi:hypothetical protein
MLTETRRREQRIGQVLLGELPGVLQRALAWGWIVGGSSRVLSSTTAYGFHVETVQ